MSARGLVGPNDNNITRDGLGVQGVGVKTRRTLHEASLRVRSHNNVSTGGLATWAEGYGCAKGLAAAASASACSARISMSSIVITMR